MANPKIAGRKSKLMTVEPGDYYWCMCKQSDNKPFCDGKHRDL